MKMWHMLYDQLLTILSPKGLRTIGREIFTEVLHVLGEKFSIFFWNGGDLLYFKGYLIVCYPTPFCWGGGRLNLLLNFQKGGLFRGSFLRGGGVKLPPFPPSKTCYNYDKNLKFGTQVHTHICGFRKYNF